MCCLFFISTKFKKTHKHFLLGNKSGNRRTANIKSIGYSDLFSLSKEDLTDVLSEFPAAKRLLEEKGRQILTKMGMLEESGQGEEKEEENVETRIKRLEDTLEVLQTKLARLIVELESSNRKMQARVEQLEWEVAAPDNQLPEDERDEEGAQGRGEGVGGETEWEREEAEGEEEESLDEKKKGQGEDGSDVTKEGDGESTKSTKEDVERILEGDQIGPKDPDVQKKKTEDKREKKQEKGDDRPRKGDGAEIELENKKEEKSEGDSEEGKKKDGSET